MRSFCEFFAGGGMVSAALGADWQCVFANDIDPMKAAAYKKNWGGDHLTLGSVSDVKASQIPDQIDMSWASFPCQDLSLAGAGAGLQAERSGTFWPFWKLMESKIADGNGPRIIALENVYGALTSNGGNDFKAICEAYERNNYRVGAFIADAAAFLPQSRKRLFIVGVRNDIVIPKALSKNKPVSYWHPSRLVETHSSLSEKLKTNWLWWDMPMPDVRTSSLSDYVGLQSDQNSWHSKDTTERLLSMMSPTNLAKVAEAKKSGIRTVGGIYRRTRNGQQRAEVRFDLAGCLRTPSGGSSKQTIIVVEGNSVKTRLLSGREAARLMGLTESYALPERENEAYKIAGDGVAVPVVEYLGKNLFTPLLESNAKPVKMMAA